MLVLTRKPYEEVVIRVGGEEIVVKILEVDRNKVRLGFIASKDIPIYRREVQDRIDNVEPSR